VSGRSAIPRESHLRSVLKGLSWRILATSTTIVIAGLFLRDWAVAAAIGGTEMVAKFFLYYLHERLWQLVPAGLVASTLLRRRIDTSTASRYRESPLRSVMKTASWRLIATGTTMAITWGATSDAVAAAWIGGVEAASKLFLYYGHERAWQRLPRGSVRRALRPRTRLPDPAD